jgi:membrane associated rhomboid family serine protease
MNGQDQFRYSTGVIGYPILFIMVIWVVFWIEVRFGIHFSNHGIYPRAIEGLEGIFFSPFLHSGMEHLYHNSIPLFVLSMALFYFYREISWKVILWGILLSGLLTWLIGRPANHIGASGVIYVLMSFILFKGIFASHFRLIALSLLVVFLYGSMIWYVFPIKQGMSWEGHLSGFVVGFIFSLMFRKRIAKPHKYAWEAPDFNEDDDPFLKHFDEDGNFIESLPEKEIDEDQSKNEKSTRKIRVTYHFKKKNNSQN